MSNSSLVSERGVVVLRDQHVNPSQMRDLVEKLSFLAGSVCHHYFFESEHKRHVLTVKLRAARTI